MAMTLLTIDDELVEKSRFLLKKMGKNAIIARKLEAIIMAKKIGISKTSEITEISRGSITS